MASWRLDDGARCGETALLYLDGAEMVLVIESNEEAVQHLIRNPSLPLMRFDEMIGPLGIRTLYVLPRITLDVG